MMVRCLKGKGHWLLHVQDDRPDNSGRDGTSGEKVPNLQGARVEAQITGPPS